MGDVYLYYSVILMTPKSHLGINEHKNDGDYDDPYEKIVICKYVGSAHGGFSFLGISVGLLRPTSILYEKERNWFMPFR